MGTPSTTSRMRADPSSFWAILLCALLSASAQTTTLATPALSTPLFLPTALAFDAQGNLYFAETNRHVIRKVDLTGALTTIAGDGTQGFSGDNGPATAAQLDSPTGIALDTSGNLYLADTHNHRIRRVAAATGVITTIAGTGSAAYSGDGGPATQAALNLPSALAVDASGNLYLADLNNHRVRKITATTGVISTVAGSGQQGFAGDGGPATAAALDSPSGLTVDASGNLYLADTRNHRVRRIAASTGVITTVAGTGTAAFSGDNAAATAAALALPRGVSVDSAGNILIADSNNQRLRRISATGLITTLAGDGTQGFSGDNGPALSASLDTPRGTALSPAGLATLADTGNQRVRQLQADATIVTIAGPGAIAAGSLSLSAPATTTYGTGTLTATLATTTPPTGNITFLVNAAALGTVPLTSGTATLSTATLPAGTYSIQASYPGDLTHTTAQSPTTRLTITPAPLIATATSPSILYGQAVPALTGTLSGVLPQDAGKVVLALGSSAATLSPAGSYPIAATLTGPSAGNYAVAPLSAAVTIAKAPSTASLAAASSSLTTGQPLGLTLHIASTTSGTPTGTTTLFDGTATLATLPLSATGDAAYTTSTLAAGTHILTATYPGDGNFTPSATLTQTVAITNAIQADFTLAATGPTSQTVPVGTTATFPFSVQMQGALSSPITLAASVLPAGVMANFNPAYLPPGGAVTAFTLTVQTPKTTASLRHRATLGLAILFLPWLGLAVRSRRLLAGCLSLGLLLATTGCGARVFAVGSATSLGTSYPITVSGTATGPTGTALVHTVTVTVYTQ